MSRQLNVCIIEGRLTADPKTRAFPDGGAVTNFTIANNNTYVFKDKTTKEVVAFIYCEVKGRRGELIQERFKKGNLILVQGRWGRDEWTDKEDGTKRSRDKLVVEDFHFREAKQDADEPRNVMDESEIPF